MSRLSQRLIRLSLGFVPAVLLAGCASNPTTLEETSSATLPAPAVAPQEGEMDMDAMMAAMMKVGTPGPEHAALAAHAGKWKVDGKMYMGPGTEAMPMPATAETEVIFGGRYVIEHFHSDFSGMPFEGMLIQGYDNLSKRHWNIWMDNMNTRYAAAWGNMTEGGDLEFKGMNYDPTSPEGRPSRSVIHFGSDDHVTMTMYDTLPDGSEWLVMELDYTRAE